MSIPHHRGPSKNLNFLALTRNEPARRSKRNKTATELEITTVAAAHSQFMDGRAPARLN